MFWNKNIYFNHDRQNKSNLNKRRAKKSIFELFQEWLCYALILFILYDIVWILADWHDFKQSLNDYYKDVVVDFILCGIFSLASMFINRLLLLHIFFKVEKHRVFILCGIIVFVSNILLAACCELLMAVVLPAFHIDEIWGTSFFLGLVSSLVAYIHLSMLFSDILIFNEKENLALLKKSLKMQLDPHFVFNSLGALAGMIEEKPKVAVDYVVKLSYIYRNMMRHIGNDYITVDNGVKIAKAYVDLLNLRSCGKIVLNAEGSYGDRDECILSLSLQLLIENAVKHNSPQEGIILNINIRRQNNKLVIKNNRIYNNSCNNFSLESYGIGLANLKQRYELESRDKIEFIATPDYFEVKIPIIKKTIIEQ